MIKDFKIKGKAISLCAGILVGATIGCGACAANKSNAFNGFNTGNSVSMWRFGVTNKVQDVVDKETGVHYWAIYDENSLNALEVRNNSVGKVMVEEK